MEIFQTLAVRATAFALASSEQRSFGIQIIGVQPEYEARVSTLPGLLKQGRYLEDKRVSEVVIGSVLARNLRVSVGDELTLIGSGRDGSFAAAVVIVSGIVMALGLTPLRLGRLVMLETTLMGGIGLALGVLFGGGLIIWFGLHGFSYPGMDEMADRFNMPSRIYPQLALMPLLLGPLIVYASTLVASIYPATRLNWLEPVQAMRG